MEIKLNKIQLMGKYTLLIFKYIQNERIVRKIQRSKEKIPAILKKQDRV